MKSVAAILRRDGHAAAKTATARLRYEKGISIHHLIDVRVLCDIICGAYDIKLLSKSDNFLQKRFIYLYALKGIPLKIQGTSEGRRRSNHIYPEMESAPVKDDVYRYANDDKFNGWVKTDSFLRSREWKEVRYEVIRKSDNRCQCCGRGVKDGIILHVDHIKPRSRFPELALNIDNLQVLCEDCNIGKGARDM